MPLVDMRCLNCGDNTSFDDTKEKAFCSSCGSEFDVQEAVQKVKFEGTVNVDGIAGIEKQLENAVQFTEFGEVGKAQAILKNITEEHPSDYRGWWGLAWIGTYHNKSGFNRLGNYNDILTFLSKAIKTCNKDSIKNKIKLIIDGFNHNIKVYKETLGVKSSIKNLQSDISRIQSNRLNCESNIASRKRSLETKIKSDVGLLFKGYSLIIGFAFLFSVGTIFYNLYHYIKTSWYSILPVILSIVASIILFLIAKFSDKLREKHFRKKMKKVDQSEEHKFIEFNSKIKNLNENIQKLNSQVEEIESKYVWNTYTDIKIW